MKILRLPSLIAVAFALIAAPAGAAALKPGLLPYAGSYTGTAVSKTSTNSLSGSATLTFTGRKHGLNGTFLYTGILNQGGVSQTVVQTFNISSKGILNGRVTVGATNGTGTGRINLIKTQNTVKFTTTYKLYGTPATTITLTGKVVFKPKRAVLTATVTSTDPAYAGTLSVTGRR